MEVDFMCVIGFVPHQEVIDHNEKITMLYQLSFVPHFFNLNLFLDHFSIAFFEGTRQLSLSCPFLLLFLYILVSPNGWQSSFAFSLVFALTEPHRRFADRLVCGWILVFITVVIHPSIHYHVQYVYDNDALSCILLHFRYLRNFLVFSFACGAAGWAVASSDEFSPSS